MSDKIQIGYLKLEEPAVYKQLFETASWYQNIQVEAGKYPIYSREKYNYTSRMMNAGHMEDNMFGGLKGTIISSNFDNGRPDEDKGMEATYVIQPYGHSIARGIIENGSNYNVELLPEFHARKVYYVYHGELKNSYGIYRTDKDVVPKIQGIVGEEYTILQANEREGLETVAVGVTENLDYYYMLAVQDGKVETKHTFPIHKEWEQDGYDKVRQCLLRQW